MIRGTIREWRVERSYLCNKLMDWHGRCVYFSLITNWLSVHDTLLWTKVHLPLHQSRQQQPVLEGGIIKIATHRPGVSSWPALMVSRYLQITPATSPPISLYQIRPVREEHNVSSSRTDNTQHQLAQRVLSPMGTVGSQLCRSSRRETQIVRLIISWSRFNDVFFREI